MKKEMTHDVAIVTSIANRANILLEAIDEELVKWHEMSPAQRGNKSTAEFLGMTSQEYARYLFDPYGWSQQFVSQLSVKNRQHSKFATSTNKTQELN